jgi:carboxy-cis,cis-muconate cyclase
VLGTDSIEMYTHDPGTGLLTHIFSASSPRGANAHDGPRHVKVHPNGKVLYCVTEHTNFVDAYSITSTSLVYISSRSLLPANTMEISRFRGDTLLLSPSTAEQPTPLTLFATTRGATTTTNGWLSVFSLDADGSFSKEEAHYETATSGGKANAIDLLAKSTSQPSEQGVWVLLTDDDDSAVEGGHGVQVLEWDGWGGGLKEVAGWPAPGEKATSSAERMAGGSHALWLD